jgi:hypothetical protein
MFIYTYTLDEKKLSKIAGQRQPMEIWFIVSWRYFLLKKIGFNQLKVLNVVKS